MTEKPATRNEMLRPSEPRTVYPPVGYCIYCGESSSKLTTEHVIPFGLSGNVELPQSSCIPCATETGRVEQYCLRTMFGNFRATMDMPTRKPKQRPKVLTLRTQDASNKEIVREVPLDKHPKWVATMRIGRPGILDGKAPEPGLRVQGWSAQLTGPEEHVPKGERLVTGWLHMDTFVRMLAKIGHSYAMAVLTSGEFPQLGEVSSWQQLLPDIILGKQTSCLGHVIGGEIDLRPPEPKVIHNVRFLIRPRGDSELLICQFRMFAVLGGPDYYMVVGRRPRPGQFWNAEPFRSQAR